MSFTVLDVTCPLILGMPFLRQANPVIDWTLRKVVFNSSAVPTSTPCTNLFAGLADSVPLLSSSVPPLDEVQHDQTSSCFSKKKRVNFDPTTVALHDCSLVGGFVVCFDAALSGLKAGKTLKRISCPHCNHPVFDSTRTSSFPDERTCRACLRTFPCPAGVYANPLADFIRGTRAGALLQPGRG